MKELNHEKLGPDALMQLYLEKMKDANQFVHRYLTIRLTALSSIVVFFGYIVSLGLRFNLLQPYPFVESTQSYDRSNLFVRAAVILLIFGLLQVVRAIEDLFGRRYSCVIGEARRYEKLLAIESLHENIRERDVVNGEEGGLYKRVVKRTLVGIVIVLGIATIIEIVRFLGTFL